MATKKESTAQAVGGDPQAPATAVEATDRHPPEEANGGPGASAEDVRTVERVLARDEAAFAALVRRHQAVMLRVAQSLLPSRAVAEEVVQETWLAVLEGLPGFEGRSSLRTWIFRILVNRARTRGVREARSVPFSAFGGPGDADEPAVAPDRFNGAGRWSNPPEASADAEQLLLRAEVLAEVERAIEALPPNLRTVLTLRDVAGWSASEVCNVLEVTETNQRVLLHRARSRVRAAVESRLRSEGK